MLCNSPGCAGDQCSLEVGTEAGGAGEAVPPADASGCLSVCSRGIAGLITCTWSLCIGADVDRCGSLPVGAGQ